MNRDLPCGCSYGQGNYVPCNQHRMTPSDAGEPPAMTTEEPERIAAIDQQAIWAEACKMTAEVAGRVSAGADLSLEMATEFRGIMLALAYRKAELTTLREQLASTEAERDRFKYWVEKLLADRFQRFQRLEQADAEVAALRAQLAWIQDAAKQYFERYKSNP